MKVGVLKWKETPKRSFSYSANATKGKTVPQTLTSIQQAIQDQAGPAALTLIQAPDGRYYHKDSGLVFIQRENEGWIAVGVMDGPNTAKLTANETYVCYGNRWRWDQSCVEDAAAQAMGHSLVIGTGESHPLVQNGGTVVAKKLESIGMNAL